MVNKDCYTNSKLNKRGSKLPETVNNNHHQRSIQTLIQPTECMVNTAETTNYRKYKK
jgi:hypothetical protein